MWNLEYNNTFNVDASIIWDTWICHSNYSYWILEVVVVTETDHMKLCIYYLDPSACDPNYNVNIIQHELANRPNGNVELTCICSGVPGDDIEFYWWLLDDHNSPLYTYSVSLVCVLSEQYDYCFISLCVQLMLIHAWVWVCVDVCSTVNVVCSQFTFRKKIAVIVWLLIAIPLHGNIFIISIQLHWNDFFE